MSFCKPPDVKKRKPRKRKPIHSTGLNAGHRERSKPFPAMTPIDWVVDQPDDVQFFPDPSTLIWKCENISIMQDTHGFIQNWYNPVCHEKYYGVDYSIPPIVDMDGPIVSFNNSPGFMQQFRDTIPFLSDAELDELVLKSEERLTNVVDAELDLFNFLRELIQFCSGNIKLIRRFSDLYTRMLKAFQDAYKRLLAQGHKEAAAYWLAWNFAIKPFLSDLRAILCQISSLHKKMDWLRRNNNKVIYRTYRRSFNLPVDQNEWLDGWLLCQINKADPPEMANGSYAMQLQYNTVRLEYVARAKIHLRIPDHLLDARRGVGALWAALNGLTNPVAVVWEAIPFSWLIDYFLSYRARLFQRMYDFNPFNEGVKVLGFGHSFKWHAVASGRIIWDHPPDQTEHAHVGRLEYVLYRREAGLPYIEQASLFRVPSSWYQTSIIGAVGAQHLPKRRR